MLWWGRGPWNGGQGHEGEGKSWDVVAERRVKSASLVVSTPSWIFESGQQTGTLLGSLILSCCLWTLPILSLPIFVKLEPTTSRWHQITAESGMNLGRAARLPKFLTSLSHLFINLKKQIVTSHFTWLNFLDLTYPIANNWGKYSLCKLNTKGE